MKNFALAIMAFGLVSQNALSAGQDSGPALLGFNNERIEYVWNQIDGLREAANKDISQLVRTAYGARTDHEALKKILAGRGTKVTGSGAEELNRIAQMIDSIPVENVKMRFDGESGSSEGTMLRVSFTISISSIKLVYSTDLVLNSGLKVWEYSANNLRTEKNVKMDSVLPVGNVLMVGDSRDALVKAYVDIRNNIAKQSIRNYKNLERLLKAKYRTPDGTQAMFAKVLAERDAALKTARPSEIEGDKFKGFSSLNFSIERIGMVNGEINIEANFEAFYCLVGTLPAYTVIFAVKDEKVKAVWPDGKDKISKRGMLCAG